MIGTFFSGRLGRRFFLDARLSDDEMIDAKTAANDDFKDALFLIIISEIKKLMEIKDHSIRWQTP